MHMESEMERKKALFAQAVDAVLRAGKLITAHCGALATTKKSATDFVTEIDIAVQAQLQEALFAVAPAYQFMGEEKDNDAIDFTQKLWILDPVDGTTNLIHHFRHSAISLAMADGGQVFGGIVYQPFSGELFTALVGEGAYLNGEPISVSQTACMRESLISVGTNPGHREDADAAFAIARRVYERCCDIRRIGSAAIELCYVASGRLDGFVEHRLKAWDYAAGELILREAGGMLTDYDGKAPVCGHWSNIVATNGKIHAELMAAL